MYNAAQYAEMYARDGFAILPGAARSMSAFRALKQELEAYVQLFVPGFATNGPDTEMPLGATERATLYRGMRYLPSLSAFAACPELCNFSRQLGLAFPAVMGSCNIRMDTPSSEAHLLPWHQDIGYLLGSVNAVTYWIPLVRVNQELGGIEVLPGSHRRGLWPCEVINPRGKTAQLAHGDIEFTKPLAGPFVTIEAEGDDIVVFSQMLLHRSLPSKSPRIRWTVQIRHTDLQEPWFRAAGFPLGDLTTLDNTTYLQEWTKHYGTVSEKTT